MGLFSLFRRRSGHAKLPPSGAAADSVQHSRVRARHRLIGAAVLVAVGVIGFPLIFENQPRPIPVDIAIEIPRKEGLPPLVMPQARVTAPASAVAEAAPAPAPTPEAANPVARAPTPPSPTASTEVVKTESAVVAATRPVAPPAPAAAVEAARAQALLDGKNATPSAAPTGAARFVVQVGAFAENAAAHETRLKVEKLGLKTYAQVADTDAGKRIRVRVGPFASKEEAVQAKERLKAAGFPAVLLTL